MNELGDAASAAGAAAGAKASTAFAAAVGVGTIGGLLMVMLDPPKTRRGMFVQSMVACIGSIVFGPIAVRLLDHYVDGIDLAGADVVSILEVAAPVFFVIGALSWGIAAALVRLRHIIAERGADAVAKKAGLDE